MRIIKANSYVPISCEVFKIPFPLSFELYYSNTLLCAYSAKNENELGFSDNSNTDIPILTPTDRALRIGDIYYLFRLRSFSDNMPFTSAELFRLELSEYNPYEIVRRTHGIQQGDMYWIKFSDETISYRQAVEQMNDYFTLTPEQRRKKQSLQGASSFSPDCFDIF